VDEVSKAIGSDPRIGPQFLKASVGFGGSCFKKDILNLVYLCRTYGLAEVADYWNSVVGINDWQMQRFSRTMLDSLFNSVQGKRIALLGFAFKKDTGDVRESAAAYVAKALLQEKAQLQIYDPKVKRVAMLEELDYTCGMNAANTPDLERLLACAEDPYAACKGAHAVAVLTEWDAFKTLDWARIFEGMSKPAFLFDGRNILNAAAVRAIGFHFYAIGKPLEHEQ
jgi:UDPglucose 6-dehydrogenase